MTGISDRELNPYVKHPRKFEQVFPPLRTKEEDKEEAKKQLEACGIKVPPGF